MRLDYGLQPLDFVVYFFDVLTKDVSRLVRYPEMDSGGPTNFSYGIKVFAVETDSGSGCGRFSKSFRRLR